MMNRNRFMTLLATVLVISLCVPMAAPALSEGGEHPYWVSDEKITLTVFAPFDSKSSQVMPDYSGKEITQVFEDYTNVHIEYQLAPVGQEREQLNLMLASAQLPDIMFVQMPYVAGGGEYLLTNELIIPATELVEQYMPNFKRIYEANAELERQLRLDNGDFYFFPCIRESRQVQTHGGGYMRKDWLDQLGLGLPQTIDEIRAALSGFKTMGDDVLPFVVAGAGGLYMMTSAWGMCRDGMYLDQGMVKYGPVQPEWKEFVTEMAQWYAEGLIDPDFAGNNGTDVQNKMGSGRGGLTYASLAGGLGRQAALVEESVGGDLQGIPFPRSASGVTWAAYPEYSLFHTNFGYVITSQSKYPEECAKWIDFRYGEIGQMLLNFGVEGLSYEMIDGYPTYTDLIWDSPDGLAYDVAIAKYTMVGGTLDSFIQDPRSFAQNSLPTQRQKDANALWMQTDTSNVIPQCISPSLDEIVEYANILNECRTYNDEMFVKFVMGLEPLENLDAFQQNLTNMGIETATAMMQAAYDRYLAR